VRNEGRIEVEVLDPFALRRLSGPSVVAEPGPADDSAVERSVDVAGSSKFGVAGVCWGVPDPSGPRGGNDARLELGLVGPDGLLRGAPVTIVTSSFRSATSCTVATDQRGFLVGWYDGSELWVRRVDVRD
jgi:hypothetical protein